MRVLVFLIACISLHAADENDLEKLPIHTGTRLIISAVFKSDRDEQIEGSVVGKLKHDAAVKDENDAEKALKLYREKKDHSPERKWSKMYRYKDIFFIERSEGTNLEVLFCIVGDVYTKMIVIK